MKYIRTKKGIFIFLSIIGMCLLVVAIVMMLWNCILPEILGVKEISYWQAAGILVLSKILFGGFRAGRGKLRHCKPNWKEKWDHFSPDEQERLKQKLRERFGNSPFCGRE